MTEKPMTDDARPTTTRGLGLASALRKPRTMPDTAVDWTAWIIDIENDAKAEARATEREAVRERDAALAALAAEVEAADEPAYRHIMSGSFVKESVLMGTILPEWLRLRLLDALASITESGQSDGG